MLQSKERLLQLNSKLAQTLTEKGVEATADETTTSLVDKVAEISGGGDELPDWDDDSPIIASGVSFIGTKWQLTKKGTLRWIFTEGDTHAGQSYSALSIIDLGYQKIASKIRQMYIEDGFLSVGVFYAINCERIRFPNTLTEQTRYGVLSSLKESDLSNDMYSEITTYFHSNFHNLENVKLSSKLTTLPTRSFCQCYSLKEINLENVTIFKNYCLYENFSLEKDIVFNAGLMSIEDNAFARTRIKSITFQQPTGEYPTISSTAFSQCRNISEVNLFDGWNMDLHLQSSNLTQASLHDMIEKYADMTGQTSPVMNVGTTNLDKIDDEHKVMATAKNVTLA